MLADGFFHRREADGEMSIQIVLLVLFGNLTPAEDSKLTEGKRIKRLKTSLHKADADPRMPVPDSVLDATTTEREEPKSPKMAGVQGFEPWYAGIKIQCLTAWRHPNLIEWGDY